MSIEELSRGSLRKFLQVHSSCPCSSSHDSLFCVLNSLPVVHMRNATMPGTPPSPNSRLSLDPLGSPSHMPQSDVLPIPPHLSSLSAWIAHLHKPASQPTVIQLPPAPSNLTVSLPCFQFTTAHPSSLTKQNLHPLMWFLESAVGTPTVTLPLTLATHITFRYHFIQEAFRLESRIRWPF